MEGGGTLHGAKYIHFRFGFVMQLLPVVSITSLTVSTFIVIPVLTRLKIAVRFKSHHMDLMKDDPLLRLQTFVIHISLGLSFYVKSGNTINNQGQHCRSFRGFRTITLVVSSLDPPPGLLFG